MLSTRNRFRLFRTPVAIKLSNPRTSARASNSRMRSPNFHLPLPVTLQGDIKSFSAMLPRAENWPPSPNGTSGNELSTIQTSSPDDTGRASPISMMVVVSVNGG